MPKYRITGPDGGTYEVTAPDGASEADVLAYAQQNYKAKPKAELAPLTADPTDGMSGMEKFNAGVGKAFADIGLGVKQRLGMAPRSEADEVKKRDAALTGTGAGLAGNIMGNVSMLAPAALIPGAATVPGAAAVGGLVGALQPSASSKEDAANIGLAAAGGAAGQWLTTKAPGVLQSRIDKAATAQQANAQKFAAGKAAAKEGYVIPPADLEPGVLTEAASGLSGKIKTAQVASQRNQQVTDRLARQSVGLKADDKLTADVLQTIRNQASTTGYAPIRNAGTVTADKQFFTSLDNIANTQQGASRSFPGVGDNGVLDLVAKLKQQSFDAGDAIDATRVLREAADKAYRQGDKGLGKANKAAADAIEDMLDRHLTASGNADAVKAFRDARTLIAKTYTVQKGLNDQTGNVAADKLAKELAKGRPLTGEQRTIAETAQAFPKATQSLKETPKAVSPLDFAVATTAGMSTGNPLAALLLGARPIARNALLSGPVQANALRQTTPVPFTQATQKLLENRLAQMMLGPTGAAVGLEVAR